MRSIIVSCTCVVGNCICVCAGSETLIAYALDRPTARGEGIECFSVAPFRAFERALRARDSPL